MTETKWRHQDVFNEIRHLDMTSNGCHIFTNIIVSFNTRGVLTIWVFSLRKWTEHCGKNEWSSKYVKLTLSRSSDHMYSHRGVWFTSKKITSTMINDDKYADFIINADKYADFMINADKNADSICLILKTSNIV